MLILESHDNNKKLLIWNLISILSLNKLLKLEDNRVPLIIRVKLREDCKYSISKSIYFNIKCLR